MLILKIQIIVSDRLKCIVVSNILMKRKLKCNQILFVWNAPLLSIVWWERKLQDRSKCGNILSLWSEFKSAIRKQFYPLGYLHKAIMEWKTLGQSNGQTVQSFMEEFRKKALALNIHLDSQETLMKYIGTLHSYIRHTLILFKPPSLHEVCV